MKILITRPEPKAHELQQLCAVANIDAKVLPLLNIAPIDARLWQAQLSQNIDGLIFVSTYAAQYFTEGDIDSRLKALPCFAIGKSTAEILSAHGFSHIVYPETRENSEALLKLHDLQNVRGKNFLIVHGQRGRDLIRQTLHDRGAQVAYVAVYENTRRTLTADELLILREDYDVIVVTSMDALRYLLELRAPRAEKITVMTGQMLTLAEDIYGSRLVVLKSFSNEAILASLLPLQFTAVLRQ